MANDDTRHSYVQQLRDRMTRHVPATADAAHTTAIRRPTVAPASEQPHADQRTHWRAWAREVLADDDGWMILDTETTGLGREADIIDVAAISPSGKTLISCLVRPSHPIPPEITSLTGISNAMIADAPRFPFVFANELYALLATRGVIAFNAGFDVSVLRQNIARHCRREWQPTRQQCLMWAYARYRGERYPAGHRAAGKVRVHTLENACQQMGIRHDHAHRALADCLVSRHLLAAMAEG